MKQLETGGVIVESSGTAPPPMANGATVPEPATDELSGDDSMSATTHEKNTVNVARSRTHGEETKPSFKTSELVVYVLAVIGVLVASNLVGDGAGNDGGDYFAADKAWWYITLLTVGYLVSRGLAKAGSRSSDNDPRTDSHHH
jgi:hypothetical protein